MNGSPNRVSRRHSGAERSTSNRTQGGTASSTVPANDFGVPAPNAAARVGALIRRKAEYDFDPAAPLPETTLSDPPPL